MKNSFKYLKLWQKKRSEMPLDANVETDWAQMHSLLDQHLPFSEAPGHNKPTPSKGFKLLSMMLIGLSAAAMTYVVSYVAKTNSRKHHHSMVQRSFGKSVSVIDSLTMPGLTAVDSVSASADSLYALKSSVKSDSATSFDNVVGDAKINERDKKNNLIVVASSSATSILTKTGPVKNGSTIKPGPGKSGVLLSGSTTGTNALMAGKPKGSSANYGLVSSLSTVTNSRNGSAVSRGIHAQNNMAGAINSRHGANSTSASITHRSGKNNKTDLKAAGYKGSSSHWMVRNVRSPGGTHADGTSDRAAPGNKNGAGEHIDVPNANNHQTFESMQATPPTPAFTISSKNSINIASLRMGNKSGSALLKQQKDNKKDKKMKDAKSSSSNPLNIDWGLLMGFNSAGSFTPKAQNSNFYGSLPVDPFFGLFVAYTLNDKWSIGAQVRALNPQKINGSYTHANGSKVDTNQMITVADSRKAYTVDIPLHVIYKVNDNLSFKAGPVFSVPVKAMGGSTSLQPIAIKADSNYYRKIITQIDSVKYQPKFNYGISAGVSYQVNRFIFGVDYLKNLGGYQVNSGFGNYKSHNGTLQITIGFRLNKKK